MEFIYILLGLILIINVALLLKMNPLPNSIAAIEDEEDAYRYGYTTGFSTALEDVENSLAPVLDSSSMTSTEKQKFAAELQHLNEFAEVRLHDWEYDSDALSEDMPEYQVWREKIMKE